jgi:hypothetical protein
MAGDTPNTAPAAVPTANPGNIDLGLNTAAPVAPATPMPAAAPNSVGNLPTADEAQAGMTQANAKFQEQGNELQKAEQPLKPIPPGPHARLFNMIEALGVTLSATGKTIATRGKEGGAADIQDYYARKQQQEVQAQQARIALHDENVKTLQTAMSTSMAQYNMWHSLASTPDELALNNLKVKEAQQAGTMSDIQIQNMTGLTGDEYRQIQSGKLSDPQVVGRLSNFAQQKLTALAGTASAPGPLAGDPSVAKLQSDLATPNADPITQAKILSDDLGAMTRANAIKSQVLGEEEKANTVAQNAPLNAQQTEDANNRMLARWNQLNPGTPMPAGFKLQVGASPAMVAKVDADMKGLEMAAVQQGAVAPVGDMTKTGEAYIATLPLQDQGTVRAIGEGRMAPPPAGSRSPGARHVMAELTQAYPGFDATRYPTYLKQRENFASGQIGTGINSYNTSINHLAQMYDTLRSASDADLNNPMSPARQKLKQDDTFVSMELAKAVSNGQMTQTEAEDMKKAINGQYWIVKGRDKYLNQIQNVTGLLEGKLNAYQNQWNSGQPQGFKPPFPIVSAEAQANIQRIRAGANQTPLTNLHTNGKVTIGWDGHQWVDSTTRQPYK